MGYKQERSSGVRRVPMHTAQVSARPPVGRQARPGRVFHSITTVPLNINCYSDIAYANGAVIRDDPYTGYNSRLTPKAGGAAHTLGFGMGKLQLHLDRVPSQLTTRTILSMGSDSCCQRDEVVLLECDPALMFARTQCVGHILYPRPPTAEFRVVVFASVPGFAVVPIPDSIDFTFRHTFYPSFVFYRHFRARRNIVRIVQLAIVCHSVMFFGG
jgi:hypothetical protein